MKQTRTDARRAFANLILATEYDAGKDRNVCSTETTATLFRANHKRNALTALMKSVPINVATVSFMKMDAKRVNATLVLVRGKFVQEAKYVK
jgi:hypothetical protein